MTRVDTDRMNSYLLPAKTTAAAAPAKKPAARASSPRSSPAKKQRTSAAAAAAPLEPPAVPTGGSLTAAEAKAAFVLTDTDLKRLASEKIGARLHYKAADVLAAALRKHRGEAGLEKARVEKATFAKKIGGQTLEQHRRTLGDAVKRGITVEKWCVAARTATTTRCALEVFRALVVPHADRVTPAAFDAQTPVVVAAVSKGAASIFGSTKLTGGTRMGSWSADKMELVYFPGTNELRVWWTMR